MGWRRSRQPCRGNGRAATRCTRLRPGRSECGALALLRRRPQRTVHPPPGGGIVQRIIVAGGTDVSVGVAPRPVRNELHRPPADRAQLPHLVRYRHPISLPPQLSSASSARSRQFARRAKQRGSTMTEQLSRDAAEATRKQRHVCRRTLRPVSPLMLLFVGCVRPLDAKSVPH